MKLTQLRISNFQCFGEEPTVITLEPMTFLLGPNGAGKTAALQALTRLFGFERSVRDVKRTDFHTSSTVLATGDIDTLTLWIEAQFEFPELKKSNGKYATIPSYFAHMQLATADGTPRIRFRLQAELDEDGDIEEALSYVVEVDEDDEPSKIVPVSKHDRNTIHVHYLPARRDPADHVTYAAGSLLGRALRSANWTGERETVSEHAQGISEALAGNAGVEEIGDQLTAFWSALHKGPYYVDPSVSFECSEIEKLLRQLTIGFASGHSAEQVHFSRLSDGQKSLLYLSLVMSLQAIGRAVLAKKSDAFDVDKLRPALFTFVAMEEPENSLSPHYLGRVINALTAFSGNNDAQAIIATHAPSLLRRVLPENIRYLRLNEDRQTVVKSIILPDAAHQAHKFVREAVQAFPELYFSRLVILGEGDSEEVVLPRLLQAKGLAGDDLSISVIPLGGRHVNHFWRLLHDLGIPQVTLLDLDLGRHQGGWGRVKYALQQLLKFPTIKSDLSQKHLVNFPKWDGDKLLLTSKEGKEWISFLESAGVFFSSPLDLDFAMLLQFPDEYGVDDDELENPAEETISAVLGKNHGDVTQYNDEQQQYFDSYHRRFKLDSKPAAHLDALAQLDEPELKDDMPESIDRLLKMVKTKLKELPE
ncbi:MAG TPA: AAA family ATPase [Terriglobales bacterium]|nr:AAA family ATPase [Terriglobales bacterium]